jgi:hypothetical protein
MLFYVRFHILKAASIKITAFGNIAQFSLVEVNRLFRGTYCIYNYPDDGGSMHL